VSGAAGDAWRGRLLLGPVPGTVVYVGPGGSVQPHAHHAVQVAVGLTGPVRLWLDGAESRARAVVVGASRRHAFAADGDVCMIYADATSSVGKRLSAVSGDVSELLADLVAEPPRLTSPADAASYALSLADRLGADAAPRERPGSGPVAAALEYVDRALEAGRRATLPEAAHAAALSPSRLTHHFTGTVGIPFRRYLLWRRLVRVVDEVAAGADLTRAAAAAGFSDSAHLSRTFRDNFGLPPSALLVMDVVP